MNLSRIYAIFIRQFFLIKGNPVRLVGIFLWIIIDIIQWGFISRYLSTFGQATFSFITVILGAIILFEFMSRMQTGIMTTFLEDIWSQNFFNFFASPLKVSEYLAGMVLSSTALSLMGLVVLVLIAGLGFGYNFFMIGLILLPFILILFIFGIAMGIFVTAVIFRFGPAAEWLGWPIPMVLSIFSGVFYPVATLPPAAQFVAKILPSAYVFDSLRAILATGEFTSALALNLIIGAVLAVLYLIAMYFFFLRVYRRNLKSGSIARFSAEQY